MSAPKGPSNPVVERPSRSRIAAVAAVHLMLISAGVAWGVFRWRAIAERDSLPPIRETPVDVRPLYDRPEVISDGKLQKVLYHLRPRLRGPQPRINHVDHALRFWGWQATFRDPDCLSGEEMRALLTDNRRFQRDWGDDARPLLFPTDHGYGTRTQQGGATSSHVDHTVATLAEIGTPADFSLFTPQGETTFRAMIEHAVRGFSLNQVEYEWTATIFALYMPTDGEWRTTEGQWINFDRIAERIMRQRYLDGVCFGNHRLYSLTLMLRVDEKHALFSPRIRKRALAHLREATDRLVASQSKEGWWDQNWEGSTWDDDWNTTPARDRRILATGHTLEWWAIAPKSVQPPPEVVAKGAHWLTRTILSMSDEDVSSSYTFLTHAGRALAMWRGKLPHEVDRPVAQRSRHAPP